ncbi:MAG TPA: lytic transglycosylase domain-containing protein [Bacteroidales bacterium]|nr:lytic transglycosylase domain-containing protein [Bacteroidales bacterium]
MKRLRQLLGLAGIFGGILVIFLGIEGFNNNRPENNIISGQENQKIRSYRIPDSLLFSGEMVPLENFDTRESLDRELNSNAYFHSSTLLLLKRSNRYFPVIEPILKKHGIPDDFKYIAVAESNLSNIVSPAGAVGFWQFLADTGKEYGLEINTEIDERYHLEKSTEAACRYFLKSFEKYGNWTMVAASFNRGSNGVDQQVEIQGQTNYYDLLLPEETSRYVFRILSFKIIFSDPEEYGFSIEEGHLYPEISYELVMVDSTISNFADFASKFGTNYKIFKALNPWLRKPYLNNKKGKTYELKIPSENARTDTYNF